MEYALMGSLTVNITAAMEVRAAVLVIWDDTPVSIRPFDFAS